ncbi:hypothetical protein Vretimale_14936, partial [Volvox reticuliferus]
MAPRKQQKRSVPVATAACHDLYAELGLARTASIEDIKRAYRRLALQCHPDKCPGDEAANERFQRISMAYSVLSDQQKRRYYDKTGTTEGLDISPDEFLDMFQSLLLEIIGGADMIRAMLSCFTPRELARLPPFPFPKELFPPGTFPPGLRFSCKGLKGLPPQIDELIQNGDLHAMFAAMSGLSPPSSTGRSGRNAGSSNRHASGGFAGGYSHAPPRDPHGYGCHRNSGPNAASPIGGNEFRDSDGGSSIGSSDSEWTDVSESELEAVLAQQRGPPQPPPPPVAVAEVLGEQDEAGSPPLSPAGAAAAVRSAASARSPAGTQSGLVKEEARCGAAEAADSDPSSSSSSSPLQSPTSLPPSSRRSPPPPPQEQQQQQQRQQSSQPPQQQLIRDWMMAARSCDVGALARLLEQDPRLLDCRGTGMGHTALHWCAAKGSVECVGWLLQQGTDINVRNDDGATPLHAAARNGRLEAVEALLTWRGHPGGITPEASQPTAAAAAAAASSSFITTASPEEATAVGAAALCDLAAVDGDGRTALRLALDFQHDQVAALLLRAAAERESWEGRGNASDAVVAEAPERGTGRNVAGSALGTPDWRVEDLEGPPSTPAAPAAQAEVAVTATAAAVSRSLGESTTAAPMMASHGGEGVGCVRRVTDGDAENDVAQGETATTAITSAATTETPEGSCGAGSNGDGGTGRMAAPAEQGAARGYRLGADSQEQGIRSSNGSSSGSSSGCTTRSTADGGNGTELPQVLSSSPPPVHQHHHNQPQGTTTTAA